MCRMAVKSGEVKSEELVGLLARQFYISAVPETFRDILMYSLHLVSKLNFARLIFLKLSVCFF